MNFGVADVVLGIKLAARIYDSCKNATAEYKALTVDIKSLSVHLMQIESSLSQTRNLPAENRTELRELIQIGDAILKDIEKAIHKYNDPAKQTPFALKSRILWEIDQGDIQKTKQRLRDHIHNLSLYEVHRKLNLVVKKLWSSGSTGEQAVTAINEDNSDHNWERLVDMLVNIFHISPDLVNENRDECVDYIRYVSEPSRQSSLRASTLEDCDSDHRFDLKEKGGDGLFIGAGSKPDVKKGSLKVSPYKSSSRYPVEDDDEDDDSDDEYASETVLDSPETRDASLGSRPSSISPTISSSDTDAWPKLRDPFSAESNPHSVPHEAVRRPSKSRNFFRNFGHSENLEAGTSEGGGPPIPSPPPQPRQKLPKRSSSMAESIYSNNSERSNSTSSGWTRRLSQHVATWASDAPTLRDGFSPG